MIEEKAKDFESGDHQKENESSLGSEEQEQNVKSEFSFMSEKRDLQ